MLFKGLNACPLKFNQSAKNLIKENNAVIFFQLIDYQHL